MLLLPDELLQLILRSLTVADLKSLRHVCKRLSALTLQPLFRRVHVSFLTLDRLLKMALHQHIATVVEELCYYEQQFHLEWSRTSDLDDLDWLANIASQQDGVDSDPPSPAIPPIARSDQEPVLQEYATRNDLSLPTLEPTS